MSSLVEKVEQLKPHNPIHPFSFLVPPKSKFEFKRMDFFGEGAKVIQSNASYWVNAKQECRYYPSNKPKHGFSH